MATKTRRMEMRADPDSEERITHAAELVHESVSSFVLRAATAEAERVLARTDSTLMAADQFDELMGALDIPEPAPTLSRVSARQRRFTRS